MPNATPPAVVDIAGDQQELGLLDETEIDQRVPRLERGVAKRLVETVPNPPDLAERAIEMEVGGVDESAAHGDGSTGA
ncbi:MAG: hypothetical protein ACO4B5_12400, partial [Steroidobacteraceae bacterium]